MGSSMSAMRELRPAKVRQRKKATAKTRPPPMLKNRSGILEYQKLRFTIPAAAECPVLYMQ